MSKEEILRKYKEALEVVSKSDDTNSREVIMAKDDIATYLQIIKWRSNADSVENGENVFNYLTSYEITDIMSAVNQRVKQYKKEG